MSQASLLANLVATRRLQAEPVATDAMVHLFANSPAARAAVSRLVNQQLIGTQADAGLGDLTYRGQDATGAEGRPDILGADQDGVRLIIEAKFDAELTPAQRGTQYLDRLSPTAPAVLMYLVPRERISAIWPELLSGPCGVAVSSQSPTVLDGSRAGTALCHRLDSAPGTPSRTVMAYAWEDLLTFIRNAMEPFRDQEQPNLDDLAQIEGLVTWRTRVGWTPLLPDDLRVRTARQVSALIPRITRAIDKFSATKPTGGSGDQGTGRYATTRAGARIWVGLWFTWWANYRNTPVWVQVPATATDTVDNIAARLQLGGIDSIRRPTESDVLVPIWIPEGSELAGVDMALDEQLEVVGRLVDSDPSDGRAMDGGS